MPTYATNTDLNNFFSSANITDWADKDRDGSLSSQEQLAISDAEITSNLIRLYKALGGGWTSLAPATAANTNLSGNKP